ncbi:MAG: pyridoxamine 5'-phosphate oxidase family protein [Elusimicrobiota bacterium]
MDLKKYFTSTKGLGVLATSNDQGVVNTAVYARPHVIGKNRVAFIMTPRLTHENLQSNPRASYLFHEAGFEHAGKRLMLTMVGESTDSRKIEALRRRTTPAICSGKKGDRRYLVTFRIDKVLPLTN